MLKASKTELKLYYYIFFIFSASGVGSFATLAPRNRSRQSQNSGSGVTGHQTLHRPPPQPKPPSTPSSGQRPDITRDLHGKGMNHAANPLNAGAAPDSGGIRTSIPINSAFMEKTTHNYAEKGEGIKQNEYQNSALIVNGHSVSLVALADINKTSKPVPNIQADILTIPSFESSDNSNCDSASNIVGKNSSRRMRTSSERSSVTQLSKSHHRRTPSSERNNLTACDHGSSDGSRSSNNSLITKQSSSPQNARKSEQISDYLNTDTMRRKTSKSQVVMSSAPSTIYYTTRPKRNTTPEKHRRKKSLGSYPNDEIPKLRKNSRTRSRESTEKILQNSSENVVYT